jgi:hypothetical protein
VLRNTARAKRRGWLTSASAGAEVSVAVAPRTVTFGWRSDEDDRRDAEAAEAERLRDEGKLIENEPEPSNKD